MFYTYRQNNSGGNFDVDTASGISVYVIVEADSAEEANDRATAIGLYFDGVGMGDDCDCCGDRWDFYWGDGSAVPEIYGEPVVDGILPRGNMRWIEKHPQGYIHYKDGQIQPID